MTTGMALLLLRRAEFAAEKHSKLMATSEDSWQSEALYLRVKVLTAMVVSKMGREFYNNQRLSTVFKGYQPEESMSDEQAREIGQYAVNLNGITRLLPDETMTHRAYICASLVKLIEIYKGVAFAVEYREALAAKHKGDTSDVKP